MDNQELVDIVEELQNKIKQLEESTSEIISNSKKHISIYRPVTESDRSAIRSVVPGTPHITNTITTGGSSYTPQPELYSMLVITAQDSALTINDITNSSFDGQKLLIKIKDNGTARAITYGSKYRASGTVLPATTTIGKYLYIAFIRNVVDDKWDLLASTTTA